VFKTGLQSIIIIIIIIIITIESFANKKRDLSIGEIAVL